MLIMNKSHAEFFLDFLYKKKDDALLMNSFIFSHITWDEQSLSLQ